MGKQDMFQQEVVESSKPYTWSVTHQAVYMLNSEASGSGSDTMKPDILLSSGSRWLPSFKAQELHKAHREQSLNLRRPLQLDIAALLVQRILFVLDSAKSISVIVPVGGSLRVPMSISGQKSAKKGLAPRASPPLEGR